MLFAEIRSFIPETRGPEPGSGFLPSGGLIVRNAPFTRFYVLVQSAVFYLWVENRFGKTPSRNYADHL